MLKCGRTAQQEWPSEENNGQTTFSKCGLPLKSLKFSSEK